MKRFFSIIIVVFLICLTGMALFARLFVVEQEGPSVVQVEEDLTAELFISTIGETARELAAKNDLYASVMLAQALLESNKGQSGLASAPNFNLFGIKGNYQNASVALETTEDDGTGQLTTIVDEFRQYPSYEASLADYVKLLRSGVSWNKEFYHPAFKSNTSSYRDVTRFLTGTYATDTKYEEKLNALIAQYDLTKYDNPIKDTTAVTVEPDDSLVSIAERYDVSVTSLKQWNKLQSSYLQEGQVLMIYHTVPQ